MGESEAKKILNAVTRVEEEMEGIVDVRQIGRMVNRLKEEIAREVNVKPEEVKVIASPDSGVFSVQVKNVVLEGGMTPVVFLLPDPDELMLRVYPPEEENEPSP